MAWPPKVSVEATTTRTSVCAAPIPLSSQLTPANPGLGGGYSSQILTINFKSMKDFTYKQSDQTVTFEPGVTLGDLDSHLEQIHRVMAYGVVAEIGTGGHLAIGGFGPLSRQLGIAADQIISAECVLGNGSIVTTSNTENPDLLFAIKGAAWSFALVTSFTMQTSSPPSTVISYQYNVTAGSFVDLADTFKAWQKFVSQPDLDRRFASTLTLANPGLMVFSGSFFGDKESFDQLNIDAILPSGNAAVNVASSIGTQLIYDLSSALLDVAGGIPAHFYGNSLKFTNETLLPDAAVDKLFHYFDTADAGTPIWFVVWDLQGGAVADISPSATAYWHRDAIFFSQGYVVSLLSDVSDTSKAFLQGMNSLAAAAVPVGEAAYAGYVDQYLEHPLLAYWGDNVPKLKTIKSRYDPGNTFRNQQSIPLA